MNPTLNTTPRVTAWKWTNTETPDYQPTEIHINYDPECSSDFDGIAFHLDDNTTFTVALPDLLEAIAQGLRR